MQNHRPERLSANRDCVLASDLAKYESVSAFAPASFPSSPSSQQQQQQHRHRPKNNKRKVLARTNIWNMADSSLVRITNGDLQAGCVKCTWMPNWSHNNTFSSPSGFALALERNSERAVVSPYIFRDPRKYAYGTVAIQLPIDAKNKLEGTPIVEFLRRLDRKSGDRTAAAAAATPHLPSTARLLERVHDSVPGELLEHPGSFAGLYASFDRKRDFSERLWVVVQAGDASAAEEAHRVVQEEAPGGKFNTTDASWHSFVEQSNSPFRKAKDASRDRRASIVRRLMDELLDVNHLGKDVSAYSPITTISDVFSRLRYSGKTCVYYSGCTPAKQDREKGRVVLNESPRTGIFVLHGVKPVIKYLGAFPYGTGRVGSLSPSAIRERSLLSPSDAPLPPNVFCWEGGGGVHPRLHHPASDLFRMRDREFREMEIKLGRDPSARVVHLRPIAVKMASPPSKQQQHRNRRRGGHGKQ